MYIFISHASEEASTANALVNSIEKYGDKCFIAPRDIRTGYEYASEIAEGIDRSDILILLLSQAANASPHVLREVERAVTRNIPVLVYKLEDVTLSKSMEYFLMTHQWLNAKKNDFSDVLVSISEIKKNKVDANLEETITIPTKREAKPVKAFVIPFVVLLTLFGGLVAALIILIPKLNAYMKYDSPTTGVTDTTTTVSDIQEESSSSDITEESTTVENTVEPKDVELGDTIFLGTYNNEPIEWKVINISEDKQNAVLISKYILSFKGYDAPEKGSYGGEELADSDYEIQAFCRGNNSWDSSSIREWLNSDREYVKYSGQVPSPDAFADRSNGYHMEPGFLYNFSDEEIEALVDKKVVTKGNVLSKEDEITTYDKVFLLSEAELAWLDDAGIPHLAEPTNAAVKKNETFWYRDYCLDFNYKTAFWWLREPVDNSSSCCYLVDYGKYDGQFIPWEVGVESFGIRPAIYVNLNAECIEIN